ncbi:DNA-directed RNA polymerase II subunit RPB1-like isoform X2 [Cyprinodon tularosa]|nr:DNA-directed RNA polymerase II subunit RPB1-like isoform X2 [Cyprinodon tularosa]
MKSLSGASPSSSSPEPPQRFFSLQSPEVQEEFRKERLRRLKSRSDTDGTSSTSSSSQASPLRPSSPQASPLRPSSPQASPLNSPFSLSPSVSPSSPWKSSPRHSDSSPGLSLSSPELISEMKGRAQPLRHVPQRKGLTTVFSGRGRQVPGSSP